MNEESGTARETFASRAGEKADDTFKTLLYAILVAFVVRAFLFEPFNIPSGSMVPGLLVGDFLFVSKYAYGYSSKSSLFGLLPMEGRIFFKEPARGDVVVFKMPRDGRTDYIKRLVGLPGDTVQVKHGLLYVNGVSVERTKLDEPVALKYVEPAFGARDYEEKFHGAKKGHVIREEGDDRLLDDTELFSVPSGHYFFMGDNRDNSLDSRTDNVGFVPADNLVGRAETLFFSLGEDARFWEIWKWPFSVRWGRFFMRIR